MNTWGKHCNKLLFFTKSYHTGFPAVGLGIEDTGSYDLAGKIMKGLYHLYKYHLRDYDWFVKADTDTYLIAENLRYFLKDHEPTEAVYFGHHFKVIAQRDSKKFNSSQ